jgi:hypothetical protein
LKVTLEGGTPTPRATHRQDTYFIGAYTKTGKLRAIKIGLCARGTVKQRLRNLQTGSLDRLVVLGVYCGAVEKKLHRMFAKSRLRRNSEYFRPTKPLLELIERLQVINADLAALDIGAVESRKPQEGG